jgi:hypothetical protein
VALVLDGAVVRTGPHHELLTDARYHDVVSRSGTSEREPA